MLFYLTEFSKSKCSASDMTELSRPGVLQMGLISLCATVSLWQWLIVSLHMYKQNPDVSRIIAFIVDFNFSLVWLTEVVYKDI